MLAGAKRPRRSSDRLPPRTPCPLSLPKKPAALLKHRRTDLRTASGTHRQRFGALRARRRLFHPSELCLRLVRLLLQSGQSDQLRLKSAAEQRHSLDLYAGEGLANLLEVPETRAIPAAAAELKEVRENSRARPLKRRPCRAPSKKWHGQPAGWGRRSSSRNGEAHER